MINFRKFGFLKRKSLIGKILRLPFQLVPQEATMRILSGSLRGLSWINGSHNRSVWLGIYERKQTTYFVKKAAGMKVFWDLGSHVGYYTMLFSKINKDGISYCFEPMERNTLYFKKHMELNGFTNFKCFPVAVSNAEGILRFAAGSTSVAGKLAPSGEIEIKTIRLSQWYEEGKIELPDIIKMDIEGAEADVLDDLRRILTRKKPSIFLSTHGQAIHNDCVNLLTEIGYKLTALDAYDLLAAREILAEF